MTHSSCYVVVVYRAFLLIISRLLRGVWARAVPLSHDYDNDHHYDNNNSGISQVRGPRFAFTMLPEGLLMQCNDSIIYTHLNYTLYTNSCF